MAVRKIRIWPDPALKEVAKPVKKVDAAIRTLVADLFDTMYKANGVGLAATQVAEPVRVLVIDLDPHGEGKKDEEVAQELASWGYAGPTVLINPEIVSSQGEILWREGCLSVPGVSEEVTRHEEVKVRALGTDGKAFELEAKGLFAIAIQHEMDHLDGRVFVEYLSRLKRESIKRKMDRLKADAIDDGVVAAQAL